MAGEQWFVRREQMVLGPYDREELKALIARQKIGPDDLISSDGTSAWTPTAEVPVFRTLVSAREVPPSPLVEKAVPSKPSSVSASQGLIDRRPTTARSAIASASQTVVAAASSQSKPSGITSSTVNLSVSPPTPPQSEKPHLSAGLIVDRRYRLATQIGEGTFGDVWRAEDIRLSNRAVAVKFLKQEFSAHREAIVRFEAEADALAQVQHTNVVGVFDRGVWDDRRYLVTEFVAGSSLARWLDAHRGAGILPQLSQVRSLLDQICAGVEAAHLVRTPGPIVHRDLKPDNVLIREQVAGETIVKIVDFGIAQLGGRSGTRTGAMMGTHVYMAPEQALGNSAAICPATDVFALAVIAIELLTLRAMPGEGEPWWGTAMQRAEDVPGLLVAMRADIPPGVWEVLGRGLRARATDRIVSARVLRSEVREAFDRKPIATIVSVPRPRPDVLPSSPSVHPTLPMGPTGTVPLQGMQAAAVPAPATHPGGPAPTSAGLHALGHPSASSPQPHVASQARGRFGKIVPRTRLDWILAGLCIVAGTAAVIRVAHSDSRAGDSNLPGLAVAQVVQSNAVAVVQLACPEGMVQIPAGRFPMGSAEGLRNERPQHEVRLDSYCFDRTEVTTAQYHECVGAGSCEPAGTIIISRGEVPATLRFLSPRCNENRPGSGEHPINCVDWHQAAAYCQWRGARLPTEAEWEYAAAMAGGDHLRRYPWGDEVPSATRLNAAGTEYVTWMRSIYPNAIPMYRASDGFEATAPKGSYPDGATPLGIQDMAGNVCEWVADWYADSYSGLVGIPDNPTGPLIGTVRVVRGAGWNAFRSGWARAKIRDGARPSDRLVQVGIRCASALGSGAIPPATGTSTTRPLTARPAEVAPPDSRDAVRQTNAWVPLPGRHCELQTHEVSRAEYAEWLAATSTARVPWEGSRDPQASERDLPVAGVEWSEATLFCTALGARLPLQAEWLSGYRRPTSPFHLGTAPHVINSAASDVNSAGLRDMAGNVSEWLGDPGTLNGENLQIGASFLDSDDDIAALTRQGFPVQTNAEADVRVRRSAGRGFRCARNIP